jgi:hypothetical protein
MDPFEPTVQRGEVFGQGRFAWPELVDLVDPSADLGWYEGPGDRRHPPGERVDVVLSEVARSFPIGRVVMGRDVPHRRHEDAVDVTQLGQREDLAGRPGFRTDPLAVDPIGGIGIPADLHVCRRGVRPAKGLFGAGSGPGERSSGPRPEADPGGSMSDGDDPGTDEAMEALRSRCTPAVWDLAMRARALMRDAIPGATEAVDLADRLLAYSFIPGTYRGLVTAITLHSKHVNLMFSKGVELLEVDAGGLLEGTGKQARHIKVRTPEVLDDPHVRALIEAAAERTARPGDAG